MYIQFQSTATGIFFAASIIIARDCSTFLSIFFLFQSVFIPLLYVGDAVRPVVGVVLGEGLTSVVRACCRCPSPAGTDRFSFRYERASGAKRVDQPKCRMLCAMM